MEIQWLHGDGRMGEEEFSFFIAITDTFFAEFCMCYYNGLISPVYVEDRFTFHVYDDRPHGIGCSNRNDALKMFHDFEPVNPKLTTVPKRFRHLVTVFEDVFIKHSFGTLLDGDKASRPG